MRNLTVTTVEKLDLNKIKILRGGVVPYTDDSICLGVDSKFNELSDFGGGISYKRDGDVIIGSMREFNEESHGAFGDVMVRPDDIVVYDPYSLIIFVRVPNDINSYIENFHGKRTYKSEMKDLIWIPKTNIRKYRNKVYRKIFNHILIGCNSLS